MTSPRVSLWLHPLVKYWLPHSDKLMVQQSISFRQEAIEPRELKMLFSSFNNVSFGDNSLWKAASRQLVKNYNLVMSTNTHTFIKNLIAGMIKCQIIKKADWIKNILVFFCFAQTFPQCAHVSAAQVHIFISADCNDILQCTSCCEINTPMRTEAARPCTLHLNNWQLAVLVLNISPTVGDCLHICNVNSTESKWNEEKKRHFTCLFVFSWSMFFIVG